MDGYNIHWFKCNEKANGESFYRGHVKSGFQNQDIESTFFDMADTNIEDMEVWLNIVNISRSISVPKVLKCKGIASSNGKTFIAYEVFDHLYSSWADSHAEIRTQEWWITQARNILDSMYYMANKGIYHDGLNKIENYAVFRNDLHLLHVATKIGLKQKYKHSRMEKQCLQCLKNFMLSQADEVFVNQIDRTRFMWAFGHSTIDQLRQHPFLLTGIERYKHYRKITNLVRNHMSAMEKTTFTEKLNNEHRYYDWVDNSVNAVFRWVHDTDNGLNTPAIETPYNLFLFIEKLLDHYDANAYKQRLQFVGREGLELIISNTFDGFLSCIHNTILEMYFDVINHPHVLRITSYHSDVPASHLRQRFQSLGSSSSS